MYPGGMLHIEAQYDGSPIGMLAGVYESPEQVYAGIDALRALGVGVHSPHQWFVDFEVERTRALAARTDPQGLLNPGKLVTELAPGAGKTMGGRTTSGPPDGHPTAGRAVRAGGGLDPHGGLGDHHPDRGGRAPRAAPAAGHRRPAGRGAGHRGGRAGGRRRPRPLAAADAGLHQVRRAPLGARHDVAELGDADVDAGRPRPVGGRHPGPQARLHERPRRQHRPAAGRQP